MYTIGIDLGASFVKIGLVDKKGRVCQKRQFPTSQNTPCETLLHLIVATIKNITKTKRVPYRDIRGIGIGVPGPVDSKKGIVHYFPNIKGWEEVPLKSLLEKRLRMRVELDNDVNAMTLAEYTFGAGRGASNVVCLTLGTGVGGGIIIDGKLYRGAAMVAGEIGHMPINEDGPLCNCGGRACLERYIGNRYILESAKKVFAKAITLEEVTELAMGGNKKAVKIWEDTGKKLGVALTQVVNLLNPDRIIIGGGVSRAGRFILGPARKEVLERAMKVQARHVKIVPAKLGADAGIIGAALLVDNRWFSTALS